MFTGRIHKQSFLFFGSFDDLFFIKLKVFLNLSHLALMKIYIMISYLDWGDIIKNMWSRSNYIFLENTYLIQFFFYNWPVQVLVEIEIEKSLSYEKKNSCHVFFSRIFT